MTRHAKSAALLIALMLHASSASAQESKPFKGMLLADALRILQGSALRIVFSSAVVPPDLRVATEPRATSPRQQLEELLAPHRLEVREGPGGTLQIVRARPAPKQPAPAGPGTSDEPLSDVPRASPLPKHTEYVSVTDSAPPRRDRGVVSEMSLDRGEFTELHGSLAADPLRTIQAFRGVTAVDDFRSEFAVRGSPPRHVAVVIDGVSTDWLQHTAHGRGPTGSLTMFSGLVVESATLRTGAYPRRNSDRLGPELDLTIREGSRSEFALRGAVGGAQAVLVAEGPIGGEAGSRGSWLVSGRQSYLEWPPNSSQSSRTPFGFSDGAAKVVFDVGPTQQIALTALGGVSSVDTEDNLAPNELSDGTNRAWVFSASWRSLFGHAFVVRQQASIVTQRFWNIEQSGQERDRGANRSVAYRADLSQPVAGGLLEAGARVERISTAQVPRGPQTTPTRGSAWLRSGFAHFVWAAAPSLTLSPGLRVTSSTLVRAPAVSPWLLGEWAFRRRWTLIGSVGASRQLPELGQVLGEAGSPDLLAERAAHVELGIEQQLSGGVRWQATVFRRKESDVARSSNLYPRLVGGVVVLPAVERYANALRGTSRGLELLVSRQRSRGLSGWAAYSYGRTQQTDPARGETYWAEFDQRHTFNLFAQYRWSERASAGATFRAGSNFPVPGYLAVRDGVAAASASNQLRLPPYVRLDLRADYRLQYFGRRLTLFAEALNALNRTNVGLARGSAELISGEAAGFTDTLLSRRFGAGVVIEF